MLRPAPWDLRLAARTLALTALCLLVVALIAWVTDERGVAAPGTGGRSIGVLPLTPVAGAVAVLIALAPALAGGELRALQALGAAPFRTRAPAVIAATLVAASAAFAIATGKVDVEPLFPPRAPATDWRVDQAVARGEASTPEGPSFVSLRRGVRVDEQRVLQRIDVQPQRMRDPVSPEHKRWAAAAAVFLAGAGLAAWFASPLRRRPLRTVLTGALYGAAQVASFQAVGAGALPTLSVAAPPLILFWVAWLEHRAGGRLPREEAWL